MLHPRVSGSPMIKLTLGHMPYLYHRKFFPKFCPAGKLLKKTFFRIHKDNVPHRPGLVLQSGNQLCQLPVRPVHRNNYVNIHTISLSGAPGQRKRGSPKASPYGLQDTRLKIYLLTY